MSTSPRRLFVKATAVGALLGLPIAALMMYIAWQHNPEGEFHDAGVIHAAWFQLGLVTVGPFLGLGAVVGAILAFNARKAAG